jgi:hypothetical protein
MMMMTTTVMWKTTPAPLAQADRRVVARNGVPNVARTLACGVVLLASAAALSGCGVVSLAGSAAGAAVSVAGSVISTGVEVTGKVAGAAIDAVRPAKPVP